MSRLTAISRRALLQGAAATSVGTGLLGFPAISHGQAEAIKIGHLTPRTGFLGVLGDYAVMAADMATDEILRVISQSPGETMSPHCPREPSRVRPPPI